MKIEAKSVEEYISKAPEDRQEALNKLKEGLQHPQKAYIYHCYNHYMCPVGFEDMPTKPEIVFKKELGES